MNIIKKSLVGAIATVALSAQAAPVFNIFELGVQPEKTAQYDAVGKHNIQTSIANEQGTLAMYSVKRKDNPNMAYMIELYANDAAYQTHRATPHFQHYLRDTGAMIADKTFYEITPSELGNKGGVRWGDE